jgi:NhaP-type Na+/H+ or K+/H+ antiporter
MTFLFWLLITLLAAMLAPGFIARQLTRDRGKYVDVSGQAMIWGVGAFLFSYLAVTVPWLVVSWSGAIGAPWLITGLILGTPVSAWASKKWYRALKNGSLGGGSDKYLP